MASANTLTNLIPYIYEGLNVVSRELIGFIPAVTLNSNSENVAINQVINVPVVAQGTSTAITPGATAPDTGGMTPGNVQVTIDTQEAYPIMWTGDEQLEVSQTGLYDHVITQQFAQGFRTIANKVEAALAALHIQACRAYGTYNTQPFGTAGDFTDMSNMVKILDDNGAPSDRRAVLSTSAIANLSGKQSVLFKVNEAGTADLLRRGIIGDIQGVGIHKSGQVKTDVTVGTMASGTTNTAGYAVGATVITLATAGTGVCIAGDIITFAGDTNKYVVKSVSFAGANPAAGDTITLQEPGLRVAIAASATAITVIAATDRNMVFSRSAIVLATRAPVMPKGGDMADDVMYVTDPVSGLTFQIVHYRQYRQIKTEVALAWGAQVVAPRHLALLIG